MDKEKYQVYFCELFFRMTCLRNGKLPRYKTSAIRGGIGQMLLQMYCFGNYDDCGHCFCRESCIVQNVMYASFQIKPESVTEESAGYALFCSDQTEDYQKGDVLTFRLIFYGRTLAYFNPVLHAVYALGQNGIGADHVPFSVQIVQNRRFQNVVEGRDVHLSRLSPETLADYVCERKKRISGNSIRLKFISPCSLKYKGVFQKEFTVEPVLYAVARRIRMCHLFQGIDMEREWWNVQNLPVLTGQSAKTIFVPRYSSRSGQSVKLKGISGWMELENVTEDILEMLLAGEITGVGKNTRFGFGMYKVADTLRA